MNFKNGINQNKNKRVQVTLERIGKKESRKYETYNQRLGKKTRNSIKYNDRIKKKGISYHNKCKQIKLLYQKTKISPG